MEQNRFAMFRMRSSHDFAVMVWLFAILTQTCSWASDSNSNEDAYLLEAAQRYDIKGKAYIETPLKYYYSDLGLRNARLKYRQLEENHSMENIIYNELRHRKYNVDIGQIEVNDKNDNGTYSRKQLEVDFVANKK